MRTRASSVMSVFGEPAASLIALWMLPSTRVSTNAACSRHSATDQRSGAGLYCSCAGDRPFAARSMFSRVSSRNAPAFWRSSGVMVLLLRSAGVLPAGLVSKTGRRPRLPLSSRKRQRDAGAPLPRGAGLAGVAARSSSLCGRFFSFGGSGSSLFRIFRHEAQNLAQVVLNFVADVGMLAQEKACVFASLPQALALVGNPRAGFFQQVFRDAGIEQIAFSRNSFAVNDVEFGFAEWRGHFVLHHFGARARADHAIAVLDRLNPANIHADRRIEFQRAAAGGRFRIAEHYADLLADLVVEDQGGARL